MRRLITASIVVSLVLAIASTISAAETRIDLDARNYNPLFTASRASSESALYLGTLCSNSSISCRSSSFGERGYFKGSEFTSLTLAETSAGVSLSGSLLFLDLASPHGSVRDKFDYTLVGTSMAWKNSLPGDLKDRDRHLGLAIGLEDNDFGFRANSDNWWDRDRDWHRYHFPRRFPPHPISTDPTPEPASIMLFGTGLLTLGGIMKRRHTRPPRETSA